MRQIRNEWNVSMRKGMETCVKLEMSRVHANIHQTGIDVWKPGVRGMHGNMRQSRNSLNAWKYASSRGAWIAWKYASKQGCVECMEIFVKVGMRGMHENIRRNRNAWNAWKYASKQECKECRNAWKYISQKKIMHKMNG